MICIGYKVYRLFFLVLGVLTGSLILAKGVPSMINRQGIQIDAAIVDFQHLRQCADVFRISRPASAY